MVPAHMVDNQEYVMKTFYSSYFGQTTSGYGCQAYGQTTGYNSCTSLGVSNTGGLVNTGSPVALTMSVGLLIIIAVLVVRLWPSRQK